MANLRVTLTPLFMCVQFRSSTTDEGKTQKREGGKERKGVMLIARRKI